MARSRGGRPPKAFSNATDHPIGSLQRGIAAMMVSIVRFMIIDPGNEKARRVMAGFVGWVRPQTVEDLGPLRLGGGAGGINWASEGTESAARLPLACYVWRL